MSGEKIRLLKAYGAEIVITPTAVPPDSPESYNGVADRLAREIPGAWRPNQFANLANPEIHYRTTGPEIWEQTGGKVTAFVAGVGTGGTISGVGRYLKERNPEIKIIGADPEGSVLSGDAPKPWKVEGIGEDFVPKTFNGQVVDEWIRIGDAESFHTARAMARREGLLVGGSSGTAVAAALRYAQRLTAARRRRRPLPGHRPQLSEQVLTTTPGWPQNHLHRGEPPAQTVGDLLRSRGPRTLVTVGSEATAAEAAELLQASGISQLPVLRDGHSVGSIQEVTLARLLHDDLDPGPCGSATSWPGRCPSSTSGVQLDRGVSPAPGRQLGRAGASTATAVVDIITRIDLIQYWTRRRGG